MRSSGRKARRHLCVRPLSGSSQNRTTPACALKPKALSCCACVCTNVCVLMCTFYVHVYCVYPSFMYISMCIPVCVFLFVCLDMGFVQAQSI